MPPVAQRISRPSSDAVEAPPVPLVGQGGGREPVGHHPASRRRAPAAPPRRRAGPGRPPSAAPRPARRPEAGHGRAGAAGAPTPTWWPRARRSGLRPDRSARRRAWVDFPQPSIPSRAIRRPAVDRRSPRRAAGPRAALGRPLAVVTRRCAFLAAAFFAGGLLGRRSSWLSVFLAVAFLAGGSSWPPSSGSTARPPGARPAARRPAPRSGTRRRRPGATRRWWCRRSRRGRTGRP